MKIYIVICFLFAIFASKASYAVDDKVKIGVIVPLTGGLATIGNALKNGIELSRSKNPDKFKNIIFLYEDDQ